MNSEFTIERTTTPEPTAHFFEGPEKRLEISFCFQNPTNNNSIGLREFKWNEWQEVLKLARCTILSQKSNDFCDAYVLSESSLFVYPTKVMLKTCGSTTLLRSIPKILEYANSVALNADTVVYSRKNYLRPERQQPDHQHFSIEIKQLQDFFPEALGGQAFHFGSMTAEHWNVFFADCKLAQMQRLPLAALKLANSERQTNVTLEIMMHQLDPDCCERFFGKREERDFSEVGRLIPGTDIDHCHFEPCGYSMNGLFGNSHSTIHVTPEPGFSYASYEATFQQAPRQEALSSLINSVLELFRPSVFTVSVFEHQHQHDNETIDHAQPKSLRLPNYFLRNHTTTQFESSAHVHVWNFRSRSTNDQRVPSPPSSPRPELVDS